MKYIRFFKALSKDDVAKAGGKGASLGEITKAGLAVQPGFVVTAQAFEEFLKVTDLNVELDAILDQVDHNVMHTVDEASEKIKVLVMNEGEMPEGMQKEIM